MRSRNIGGWFTVLCLAFAAVSVHAADVEPPYKAKYPVIDVHQHSGQPTEAAFQAELKVMDQVGIARVVILDATGPDGNLPAWHGVRKKYPDRLIVFTKLDFARIKEPGFFADIVRDLERSAKLGVQGVKVWKDLGMYVRDGRGRLLAIDDERLDPFWSKCGELGLPVLIHSADPKEYWFPLTFNSLHYGLRSERDQHYHDPEMPRWEDLIRQRNHVLKKHPKTKFIGAHLGSMSFDLKQLGETLDKYPNFSVDCSARLRILGRCNPPAVRDLFAKYQDRIVFGSDTLVLPKSRPRKPGSKNITVYPSPIDYQWIDPTETTLVRRWQDRAIADFSAYFQYFETDRTDLPDPTRSGGSWLRIFAVKLPPAVLEKFYHRNAEKLIPGLTVKGSKP